MIVIYGGSGSGKSEYAEDYICRLDFKNKYYLATMDVYDAESRKRVEKHRSQRAGKGFITIERPFDVAEAFEKIEKIEAADFSTEDLKGKNNVILLECLSNLLANEMFRGGEVYSAKYCCDKIFSDINRLSELVDELIIVTNDIFEDGVEYDLGNEEYLRALGRINTYLSREAKEVYEVVVGIPVRIK